MKILIFGILFMNVLFYAEGLLLNKMELVRKTNLIMNQLKEKERFESRNRCEKFIFKDKGF